MQVHPRRRGPAAARAALVLLSMVAAARGERLAPVDPAGRPVTAEACGIAAAPPSRHDESVHFDRDGRLVERAWRLTVVAGSERVQALVRYRYDAAGRLLAAGLPDGSELRYSRGRDGEAVAVRRRPAHAPLGGVEHWLVRDVQRVAGVRRLTYGDGTRQALHGATLPPPPDPGARHVLHDPDGRRLADLDARGRMTRVYVWLDDLPVATIDFTRPRVPDAPPATLPERIGRAIAALWRWVAGEGERVRYLPSGRAPGAAAGSRPPPAPRVLPGDSVTPPAASRRRPWRRSPR